MADAGFVTLTELTDRYANFMKNPLPAGPGVCVACRRPHDPAYAGCYNCSRQPSNLAAVVPITYSINLGQMHLALRSYKDGWAGDDSEALCNRFTGELAGVLRRFLDSHEACVAAAAGVAHFDLVTTVPSATTERDRDRWRLRWIVEQGCAVTAPRYRRVLVPTAAAASGKSYNPARYGATMRLDGRTVLLIDDTWTRGASAQSAAAALVAAGATRVALVVLGRHIDPDWRVVQDQPRTCGDVIATTPPWSWTTCAVHRSG
jgi:hypothetical protein